MLILFIDSEALESEALESEALIAKNCLRILNFDRRNAIGRPRSSIHVIRSLFETRFLKVSTTIVGGQLSRAVPGKKSINLNWSKFKIELPLIDG